MVVETKHRTDRVQEPTLIADIQTHDTYFNSISYLFNPMRTLNIGPPNPNDQPSQDHTSWIDLVSKQLKEEQYTMFYITDEMENERSWWEKAVNYTG